MDRFAQGIAFGLLLAAAGLAGCGGSGSSILTGATAASPEAGSLGNDNPQARPIAVAWTAARAQRCGFYFDPARLRASYLAYEARQSPPDQLAKAEKSYDTTFKSIRERVAQDSEYCSDSKSAEIKKDLTRHLAGDFKPNFPAPKKQESCGFFGCAETSNEPWDAKKYWEDLSSRSAR